jgi:hypothetical protein
MQIVNWLRGKKMYLGAAGIGIAAIVFFFLGQLDGPSLAYALGAAIAIAGLSAKLNRYLGDIVTGLQDLKDKNLKAALGLAASDAAAATSSSGAPPSIPKGNALPLILILLFAIGFAAPSAEAQCRWSCLPRAFGRTARTMVTFHEDGHRAIGIALTEWAVMAATMVDARTTVTAGRRDPGSAENSILLGAHPGDARTYATQFGIGMFYNVFQQEVWEHNKRPWYFATAAIPLTAETWASWHNSNIHSTRLPGATK